VQLLRCARKGGYFHKWHPKASGEVNSLTGWLSAKDENKVKLKNWHYLTVNQG
jgi:hypothetical protein